MEAKEKYATLEDTARQTYASVVWSHKIQEKQSDIYASQFNWMEIGKIVFASATSVGIIAVIFRDEWWIKITSALLSFVTVSINSFFKSFNLQNMVSLHKAAANNLLGIREELRLLLLNIRMQEAPPAELNNRYAEIIERLNRIYADAPSTTPKAVKLASKALNIQGDNTYTDDEINRFLPEQLRKGV